MVSTLRVEKSAYYSAIFWSRAIPHESDYENRFLSFNTWYLGPLQRAIEIKYPPYMGLFTGIAAFIWESILIAEDCGE
jgi:hypothetical protein